MNPGRLISKAVSYIEPTLGSREEEYRLSFLETDKKRFSQGLALASLLVLVFIFNDYIFFGDKSTILGAARFEIVSRRRGHNFHTIFKEAEDARAIVIGLLWLSALVGVILQLYMSSSGTGKAHGDLALSR